MSLSWYINRFKTFSFKEICFRISQRAQTHFLDKRIAHKNKVIPCELPECAIIKNAEQHCDYKIFNCLVDIFKPIDWHLDPLSQKQFPKKFSHQINIRSDEFGSAKHTWEINRLEFLVYIVNLYKQTRNVEYLDLFMYHISSWKNENPYLCGVNWYSNIEVNIRLINWAYCWKLLDGIQLQKTNESFEKFSREIWFPLICEHAEYSRKHPSLYSSANNHLISEYAGLFVAACCWEIPNREKNLRYAQAGLEREILLQNSPDGINREEAAEYIQFIDDFFLVAAIIGEESNHSFSEEYKMRLHQMAHYLNAMLDVNYNYPMYGDGDDGFLLRPDAGGFFNNFKSLLTAFATFFNDASLKRSQATWDDKNQLLFGNKGKQIFESLQALGDNSSQNLFLNSGHFIFRKRENAKEIYLHFDAAPLGYLSIAAHGHADALSFILHVDGFPIFVDPGTFTYHTHKEWRRYFVGTLAHNTIRVNEKNQAQLAGPTLWLNHFKTKILKANAAENCVIAGHNGYQKDGVTHTREVKFNPEKNEFTFVDSLCGNGNFVIEIPFHLHPLVTANEINSHTFILQAQSDSKIRRVKLTLDTQLNYTQIRGQENPILGWYSEHFGEKMPTTVFYAKTTCNGNAKFLTRIEVLDD